MDAYQPSFQTLNHLHFSNLASKPTSFHLFPRLPAEVRLQIWKSFLLARRRLFTVRLATEDEYVAGQYHLLVEQKPRINQLWNVCRESRAAAREHFRLPVLVGPGNTSTLWLNPESDYLFIRLFETKISLFISFINDLKASDPRGVGLLHLVLNGSRDRTPKALRAFIPEPDHTLGISRDALETFKRCIADLKSVWFIKFLPESARVGLSPSHLHAGLNRATPLFPHGIEFDLFSLDPRPIQPSMKKNEVLWGDPRDVVHAWVDMEKKLGFHNEGSSDNELAREISHLLTVGATRWAPHHPTLEVRCDQTMDQFLQLEQDRVHKKYLDAEFKSWQEPEERKKNLLSAAGFWVFPLGTFDTWRHMIMEKGYQDLRGLHPGLGLFDLPQQMEETGLFYCERPWASS